MTPYKIILYTCICGYESYTITTRYVDTVHCCYTDTESSNQLFIQMVVAVHHRCCYFLPFPGNCFVVARMWMYFYPKNIFIKCHCFCVLQFFTLQSFRGVFLVVMGRTMFEIQYLIIWSRIYIGRLISIIKRCARSSPFHVEKKTMFESLR